MREHDIQCKVCWDNGNMIVIMKEAAIFGHYESEQKWYLHKSKRKRKLKKQRFEHDINDSAVNVF